MNLSDKAYYLHALALQAYHLMIWPQANINFNIISCIKCIRLYTFEIILITLRAPGTQRYCIGATLCVFYFT